MKTKCAALVKDGKGNNVCFNGFMTTAVCSGISVEYVTPTCCNEVLCARMYPETGKPIMCIVRT